LLVYYFNMKNVSLLFIVMLAFLSALQSQEVVVTANDTLVVEEPLDEVVVTAFNVSRPLLDTPGSLSMIGPEQIALEGGSTLMPLINQASGVFAHAGTMSTSRITIRGIGARVPYATGKIRAYFNNIPLSNGSGITPLEHMDPSVIGSMEIIKGPATSAYGAGLGGTVIINSHRPRLHESGVFNTFQAGSFGLLKNSMVINHGGETLGLNLVYDRTQSDGYRQNSRFRRDVLTAVAQFQPTAQTTATALAYFADMRGFIPSSIDSLTFMNTPQAAAQNWLNTRGYNATRILLAGVSASHMMGHDLTLDMSLFATLHYEDERRPFDFLYEDRESAGTRVKLSWERLSGLNRWQLTGGTEMFFEDFRYSTFQNIDAQGTEGDMISDNRELIRNLNFFLQGDLDRGRTNFSAGINVNTQHIDYTDRMQIGGIDRSDSYGYGIIVSPRISSSYRYHPRHAVFATISHGFSPPSLSETLTPEGLINPEIRPEKSWSLESGFRGRLWEHRVFYDLSLYRMYVQDLLVAERVGEDAWVGRNAGSSMHQGIELELEGVLLRNSREQGPAWGIQSLVLRQAFTLNHFRFTDFVDEDQDHSGNRIPGVPETAMYANLKARLHSGLYAAAGLRLVGRIPMNDANTRYSESYSLLDLMLGYEGRLQQWAWDAFLRIENVTDRHYASMVLVNAPSFGGANPRYYYPGLPLNFRFGLRIGLPGIFS
jgi:iron complex outermembrane recepter protein